MICASFVHCEGDGNIVVRRGLARRLCSHVRIYKIHQSVVGLADLFLKCVCKAHHHSGGRAAFFFHYLHAARTVAVISVVALRDIDKFKILADNGTGCKLCGNVVFDTLSYIGSYVFVGIADLKVFRIVIPPFICLETVRRNGNVGTVGLIGVSETACLRRKRAVISEKIRIEQFEYRSGFLLGVGAHVDKLCLGEIAVSVCEGMPAELLLDEEPRAVCTSARDCAFNHEARTLEEVAVAVVAEALVLRKAEFDRVFAVGDPLG